MGCVGTVDVRVPGGDAPGEVELVLDGIVETWLAYAPHEVPVGSRVLVIHERGGRALDVVPWDIGQE